MSLEDLLNTPRPPEPVPDSPEVPKGWEPALTWNGTEGTITTGPRESDVDPAVWRELIADWGLDPDGTEVVDGSVKLKGWDSPVKGTRTGEKIRLRSYTATIRRRRSTEHRADVDALCKLASRRKPPRKQPVPEADAERALVVCLSDLQLGKGEGDGTEGTINRVHAASERLVKRLAELKKVGRPIDVVYVVGMGDLVEGCSGHYAQQTFSVDMTRRDQLKVGRRLILQLVDRLVDAGYRIVLTGVAGNHGENRNGSGKSYTSFEDNDDLAMIEQVGDILASNPDRYANVTTYLPEMLSMTLDVCGTRVGFAHGHQCRGGVEKWWKDQIVGNQPTAPAHVLVTGHFHHLVVSERLGRTWLQCPAMDPGSRWWTETSGAHSPAGLLTFAAGAGCGPRGYDDLAVL